MSKFILLGLLIGSLLGGAVPAMAIAPTVDQPGCPGDATCQGGIGDPLTLAASGILIPFVSDGNSASLLQLASPVSDNPNAHLFFFRADCSRIPISVGIPLTTNDIAFQVIQSVPADPSDPVPPSVDGLVAIAQSDPNGFHLVPLDFGHPLHARVYLFSALDGRSRVIEPIILDTAEFGWATTGRSTNWWSPLRTGGDFFAPLQTAVVKTDLLLVCPTNVIQGGAGESTGQAFGNGRNEDFFTLDDPGINTIFPGIEWEFPSLSEQTANIRVRIYDTNEVFKRDLTIDCHCVSKFNAIATSIHPIYGSLAELGLGGSYTEMVSAPPAGRHRTTFTGYTSTFTVGSPINAFFARFQNGSNLSIDGSLTDRR